MLFNSLKLSAVSDNRKFQKSVKHIFLNKGNFGNKIKLIENKEIIDGETKVAEKLYNCLKPR